MFAPRYFARRYFAPRYFAEHGAAMAAVLTVPVRAVTTPNMSRKPFEYERRAATYQPAELAFPTGASGTFTTNDGKTVTVTHGIITSIV